MRKSFLAALFLAPVFAHADQLLPTVEGTKWEYDSIETLTGTAPVHSIVIVRASKQLLDKKEVVRLETFSGTGVIKTELVNVDDDGITCLTRSGSDGKVIRYYPPEPVIDVPLKVGTDWDVESFVEGIKTRQHFTIVAEEQVAVPAGRFKAFHLHGENASLLSTQVDQWFVPGTGFVKETTTVRGPGLMHQVTLALRKVISPEQPKPAESPTPATSPIPLSEPITKNLTVEVSANSSGGLQTEFKSDVANIYVRWQGHDLPENARIRVVWVAEDVGDLVDPNFIVDETETIAPIPNASARFTLGRPPDGWAEGKYRVEFYINDILTETVKVTIGL